MLGGSVGVEVVWGEAPHNFLTPQLPPSISPPHLEWVLVPPPLLWTAMVTLASFATGYAINSSNLSSIPPTNDQSKT
eukprot:gene26099-biopygen13963